MSSAWEITITRAERSKLQDLDPDHLPFGKYFSDHMLEADYGDGNWKNARIRPYQSLSLDPSVAALHYGQAIFEGIKAYKDKSGNAAIFRPNDNFKRFNISAKRMQMPEVPEELFMDGMRQLVAMEKDWIPSREDHSLYIRPLMFATDEIIGVRPSDNYKFIIMLSPTGPYYTAPMRIYVEEQYVRAVHGGVGFAKAAGNYGAAMFPTAQARLKGYDQVLWTDASHHQYVQEIGTMNVFFVIGDKVITPGLEEGTILDGVTRQSVIALLSHMGTGVEERPLGMDEIVSAYREKTLLEVFGAGTAATIAPIRELMYKDYSMKFETEKWKIAPTLKSWLMDIREGKREDLFGWMYKI